MDHPPRFLPTYPAQVLREAMAALKAARPGVELFDRRRKVEWAMRLQQRWARCAQQAVGSGLPPTLREASHSAAACRRSRTTQPAHDFQFPISNFQFPTRSHHIFEHLPSSLPVS